MPWRRVEPLAKTLALPITSPVNKPVANCSHALALLSVPFLLSPAGAEGCGVGTGSGPNRLQSATVLPIDGPARKRGLIAATIHLS